MSQVACAVCGAGLREVSHDGIGPCPVCGDEWQDAREGHDEVVASVRDELAWVNPAWPWWVQRLWWAMYGFQGGLFVTEQVLFWLGKQHHRILYAVLHLALLGLLYRVSRSRRRLAVPHDLDD